MQDVESSICIAHIQRTPPRTLSHTQVLDLFRETVQFKEFSIAQFTPTLKLSLFCAVHHNQTTIPYMSDPLGLL